jgi:hypothetical protein
MSVLHPPGITSHVSPQPAPQLELLRHSRRPTASLDCDPFPKNIFKESLWCRWMVEAKLPGRGLYRNAFQVILWDIQATLTAPQYAVYINDYTSWKSEGFSQSSVLSLNGELKAKIFPPGFPGRTSSDSRIVGCSSPWQEPRKTKISPFQVLSCQDLRPILAIISS